MPTYEYDCEVCGNNFELFQSISAPPADNCPNCGGAVKRRIHGGVGLIFKGSGFYLTDYKRAGSTAENKTEGGEEKAKTEGGEKAKTEGGEKAKTEEGKAPSEKAPAETVKKPPAAASE